LEQYLLASDYYKEGLIKIELPKSEAGNVINRLNNMGINEYCLMPTYDNVAKSTLFFS
jgi:hypothetical protein